MNITNDSNSHLLDGTDPDAPRNRRIGGADWRWCRQAAEDVKVLREMSDAERQHYSGISNWRHNDG